MTHSGELSEEEFEAAWNEISAELADIPEPELPHDQASTPHAASSHPAAEAPEATAGPRDWRPAADEDVEALLAQEDDTSYRDVREEDLIVTHPRIAIAWLACFFLIVLGIIFAIGLIPTSRMIAGAFILGGFICGAVAAYWSARRHDNPFDDGSRV